MKVYHGSSVGIPVPSLEYGRADTDFGSGFYVTPDFDIAVKWACRKKTPVITEYDLNLDGLAVHKLSFDSEWLNFVVENRSLRETRLRLDGCDVIIGGTVDDKVFAIVEQYEQGLIQEDVAIQVLKDIGSATQMCLKTEAAIRRLCFKEEICPSIKQILAAQESADAARKWAAQRTAEIIRNSNGSKKDEQLKRADSFSEN